MRYTRLTQHGGMLTLLLLCLALSANADGLKVAITVDDLPIGPPGKHSMAQQQLITTQLLKVLTEHQVPAIGFVNESKLKDENGVVDPDRVALLQQWLDAGMELGNHGYDHLSLHRVDPELWMADILKGERHTRPLVEQAGGELRWFRHPFLHTGRSAEVQAETKAFLHLHGYRIAPVTIDNGEWMYGGAYTKAYVAGDEPAMKILGEDYVRYMLEVVAYYQEQAQLIVGDAIPQVLLIHAYALNAEYLDRLLTRLEQSGAQWISLDQALQHSAYQRRADGYTGGGGITWLHRWSITEKRDPSIYAGEPEVPDLEQLLKSAQRP